MSNQKSIFYYKMPKRKRNLLTDAFLRTFKEELDKVFDNEAKDYPLTYYNCYTWLCSTGGFYQALEEASKKHKLQNAIYKYACHMPWYRSDIFDDYLMLLMIERNIMEEGSVDEIGDDYPSMEDLATMEKNGEIRWVETVVEHKGYRVKKREWEFIKDL